MVLLNWTKFLKYVQAVARRRCNQILTYLDYQKPPGKISFSFTWNKLWILVLIDSESPLPYALYECPAEYLDWSTYPAMYLEVWLDHSHPGKNSFYEPFQKQMIMTDSSQSIRYVGFLLLNLAYVIFSKKFFTSR